MGSRRLYPAMGGSPNGLTGRHPSRLRQRLNYQLLVDDHTPDLNREPA
jgi:hypothetical protein